MEIPNRETLFRFINPEALPFDQIEIPTGIFNDPNLSCDWEKYRTDPYTSFHIEEGRSVIICITVCDDIRNPKNPKRAGQIVDAWKQKIYHDPFSEEDDPIHRANFAHSLIQGRKKMPVTQAIKDNSYFWKDRQPSSDDYWNAVSFIWKEIKAFFTLIWNWIFKRIYSWLKYFS